MEHWMNIELFLGQLLLKISYFYMDVLHEKTHSVSL